MDFAYFDVQISIRLQISVRVPICLLCNLGALSCLMSEILAEVIPIFLQGCHQIALVLDST